MHLHSCLSPCADDDMSPWNIVGMAKLKGLDVIAITDHNSCLNAEEVMAAGKEYGVAVIPGMEITTREEVHMLAYFYSLADALNAGEEVYAHLLNVKNDPLLFGNQLIMRNDSPIGTVERLLIGATNLSVDETCSLVKKHRGIPIPAHINRGSNGMIGALGLMPFLPEYPVVEVYQAVDCPAYAIKSRTLLHSSDAHRLEDIQERVFQLDAQPTAQAVLSWIEQRNQRQ